MLNSSPQVPEPSASALVPRGRDAAYVALGVECGVGRACLDLALRTFRTYTALRPLPMNPSSSATQPPASNVSSKPASDRFRSKTLTAALAFFFGSIGAHRFYLYGMRDMYGWAHMVGT